MAEALRPYFRTLEVSDIGGYGYGDRRDFLSIESRPITDWVITNPPFRLAEDFFLHAHQIARVGVALLVRTVFLESIGRHQRVFSKFSPTMVAQFSERVPMVKGRLDPKASTATGYAWIIWRKPLVQDTRLVWIPRCRKVLERSTDYEPGFLSHSSVTGKISRESAGISDL
ncbi:methyltransferase [Mesorhizobium sp. M6A.T.Ce.TU.002.03.1.1]|uniref:methyltransferase n=1 Tax=Mesorhizobium sp. M6A.T.Ce.TU.002.03.1.1 TaxID=2496782 RepID=UPI001FE032B4|nr:methyltransferase [Mesorhizobium sp. M6A.T.Ce.TU.002.03.1.1]